MSQPFLPPEILHLPVADRVTLVEELWNSIADDEQHFELTANQKSELDRRLNSHRVNPQAGSPWEEVKQRLLAQR